MSENGDRRRAAFASAVASGMSEDHDNDEQELRRLRSQVAAQRRDIHDLDDLEHHQQELIARLAQKPRYATKTSPCCASASRRPSMSWRICARSGTR
jgi:hypothetical protein